MDWDRVAAEFLRAVRGETGQLALSQTLGYRSNVFSAWEAGRRAPTAAETLRVAAAAGLDPAPRLKRFLRHYPDFVASRSAWQGREFVAELLDALRGQTTVAALAHELERSRFSVARILSGECEPRLPEFFRFVEATTYRVLDLVAEFVAPSRMPSLAPSWASVQALRRLAYERPISEAVRCALELEEYRRLPRHEPGWIADRLGIDRRVEDEVLGVLIDSGVVRRRAGKLEIVPGHVVDTSESVRAVESAKRFWSEEAARRGLPSDGMHSYLVFTADEDLLAELRRRQLDYYLDLRTLISSRPEAERVCLLSLQLLPLDCPYEG